MLFEDQLESPGKSAGGHGQIFSMAVEDIILRGQFSALVQFQLPLTEGAVLFHQAGHLQGEVHIPVPGGCLGFFHNDVLPGDLHHVAADVDGLLEKVHVLPFETAALPSPHPRGDDEFEISFVLNALLLQRGD